MAKQIWTGDWETDPFAYGENIEPFLGALYNGRDYFEFETVAKMVQFMRTIDGIFFFHNGGKFDFHFVKPYINTDEKILLINGRLVQAKIGNAEIRDSYALIPFPLRAIGNKLDIEYWKLDKKVRHLHMPEIKKYLKADCVELFNAIEAFFDEYGRHLTAPGAAIKTLMKIEDLKIDNSGQGFFQEFQQHYFGGHCECIKPGEYHEELVYLDINSAYPRAMLEKHPIGNEWHFEYKAKPKIIPQGFYTISAISMGALCRRDEKTDGLVFDRDNQERIYHTTGWEIIAGLETNTLKIIKHIDQKYFKETKDFSKFIYHFWEKRQNSAKGSLENTFAKLMMNSAYGKFCANPENYDTYYVFKPDIAEFLVAHDWELRGDMAHNIVASKPLDPEYMRYYNVATGASITGYVRAFLHRAICSVENPIYCDTDSLIFTGKHNLHLGDKLGEWKIEGIYDEGYFAGKKLYAVKNKDEEKIATKGSKLTLDEIKRITRGEIIEYKQQSPSFSWFQSREINPETNLPKDIKYIKRNIRKTA